MRNRPVCLVGLCLTLAVAALSGTGLPAQKPPRDPMPGPAKTRTDLHGDLLPAGALARLGTLRFRTHL